MKKQAVLRGAAAVAVGGLTALTTAATVYTFIVRPRILRWGATEDEVRASLPGDWLVPHPKLDATLAVMVNATPAQIWPWIVQIGCNRAGWYSYDKLDNAGIPSAERILPEFQKLAVGDRVPATPDGRLEFPVQVLEPGRALTLGGTMDPRTGRDVDPADPNVAEYFNAAWTLALQEEAGGRTRLLARLRADAKPRRYLPLLHGALLPAFFIMQRRMLEGIKERAERTARGQVAENLGGDPAARNGSAGGHTKGAAGPFPVQ